MTVILLSKKRENYIRIIHVKSFAKMSGKWEISEWNRDLEMQAINAAKEWTMSPEIPETR